MKPGWKLTPTTRTVTPAGYWASDYLTHPENRPAGAPDPAREPDKFTTWAEHNLPVIIPMKESHE